MRLKNENPHLKIGITGCMVRKTSTRSSDKKKQDQLFARMQAIDFVFRIEDLMQLPQLLLECEPDLVLQEFSDANISDYFKIAAKHRSKAQAFVPIQTGCDKFCTYCIVPFSRGREWSRSMDEIIEECKQLSLHGCLEITLLGQTVNSYGLSSLDRKSGKFSCNGKMPFTQLLEKLNNILGLKRIRFMSPHPVHMTDDLIAAISSLEKLCPYIHLPIQAGDDEVLQRMNRTYTVDDYRRIIEKIRRKIPHCAISTDIIVGFCHETETQFENTCRLYREIEWDHAYISRYSPRQGTFSCERLNDDVSRAEKAKRWHRLNEILKEISYKKNLHFTGREVHVLVESENKGILEGRSEDFKSVRFFGTREYIGKIVAVRINKARELHLEGEIVNSYSYPQVPCVI